MAEWWREFFRPSRFPIEHITPKDRTEAELRALVRLLPKPPARVLDVACGAGRHSIGLARRGYAVLGIDQSREFLALARREAERAGVGAVFERRDMRRLGYRGRFRAAINLWTSFGYFRRPADDVAALRSMFEALEPGGRLILEVLDDRAVPRDLASEHWEPAGKGWLLQSSMREAGRDPALLTEWIHVGPDGASRRTRTRIRLYDPARLRRALRRAGFRKIGFRGGLLDPWPRGRWRRIVAVATKPL